MARRLEGARAEDAFRRALQLAPKLVESWIAYGMWLELRGRPKEAEAVYLQAAALDRGAVPRFAIANFYYRADRLGDFWDWARRTAEVPDARLEGLFALCSRASSNSADTWNRVIPPSISVHRQYLDYRLGEGRFVEARPAADSLSLNPDVQDGPRLLHYCDFELLFGDAGRAVAAWNALARRRLIPDAGRGMEFGQLLVNASFASKPLRRGFDWRIAEGDGYSVAPRPGELRVELSGKQPPSVDLVLQFIWLVPAQIYRFSFAARTDGLNAASGLSWVISEAGSSKRKIAEVSFGGDEWAQRAAGFRCPPDRGLLRLILRYERPPGKARAEGVVLFRDLRLDAIPGVPAG